MKILLQIPEGLKKKAIEKIEKLKEGNEVFLSAETCYGACDLKINEAKMLGCDKIVHFGHSKFMDSEISAEYIELREEIDPSEILEKEFTRLNGFEKIGLISSLQFLNSLEYAKKFLEGKGKKVFIGDIMNEKKICAEKSMQRSYNKKLYHGQILGCDVSNAKIIEEKVDCFLHIGSGKFHALGLKTEKPVFALDLEMGEIKKLNKKIFEKQKYAAIALAKDAKKFGILVSTKFGQFNLELAEKIKKKIENKNNLCAERNCLANKNLCVHSEKYAQGNLYRANKNLCVHSEKYAQGNLYRAYIIIMDEISTEKLLGLNLDCFINTACPRIAIDNRTSFEKPILNWDEVEEVF